METLQKQTHKAPLSIKLIACFLMFLGVLGIIGDVHSLNNPATPFSMSGSLAFQIVIALLTNIAYAVSGVGLLKRWKKCRKFAIGMLCLYVYHLYGKGTAVWIYAPRNYLLYGMLFVLFSISILGIILLLSRSAREALP